jgi:hypothetical protein
VSGPIWKYKLAPVERQVIEVDGPMRWLSAGLQGGDLVVWAIVDADDGRREASPQSSGPTAWGYTFSGRLNDDRLRGATMAACA